MPGAKPMGSRMIPVECPHGRIVDWGDFGPDQNDGSVGAEECLECWPLTDCEDICMEQCQGPCGVLGDQ